MKSLALENETPTTESRLFSKYHTELSELLSNARDKRALTLLNTISQTEFGETHEFEFLQHLCKSKISFLHSDWTTSYIEVNLLESVYSKEEITLEKYMIISYVKACLYNFLEEQDKFDKLYRDVGFDIDEKHPEVSISTQIAWLNVVGANCSNKEPNKALLYLERALELNPNGNYSLEQYAHTLNHLGALHYQNDNPEKALSVWKKIVKIERIYPGKKELHHYANNNIGIAYWDLKNYQQAEYFLLMAYSSLAPQELANTLYMTINLKELYEEKGDYKQALFYANKTNLLSDSLSILSAKAEIHKIDKIYNVKLERSKNKSLRLKRKNVIHALQFEKKKKWTLSLIALGLILGLFITIRINRKLKFNYNILITGTEKFNRLQEQYISSLHLKYKNEPEVEPDSTVKTRTIEFSDFLKDLMEKINYAVAKNKLYKNIDFQIKDLCELFDVNRSYISEAINSIEKKNYTSYINDFRVNEACEILKKSNDQFSIEGVGKMVGFKSKSAFYKAFSQNMGMTPGRYVKQVVSRD
jgi:AraC-like DNA-binding protein